MARKSRPRRTPPGFEWQGNKLVPLESTTYNEEEGWVVDPSQLTEGNTLFTNQEYAPGSEVNTFTKDDEGNTVVTTDTYGVSGDESTKTTTTETIPREKSQAEIDYYAALDAGNDPKITQAHLDEISAGAGQMYVSDFYDEGPRRQSFMPGSEATSQAGSLRRIVQDKTKGAISTRNIAPSLLNRKASANA